MTPHPQIKAKTTFTIVNFSENLISNTTEMQPNYIKKYLLVEEATSKKYIFRKCPSTANTNPQEEKGLTTEQHRPLDHNAPVVGQEQVEHMTIALSCRCKIALPFDEEQIGTKANKCLDRRLKEIQSFEDTNPKNADYIMTT